MSESQYWTRLQRKRLSRRSLIGASTKAGVGAAGLALVGCGDDDDEQVVAQVVEQAVEQAEEPAAEQVAEQAAPQIERGGTIRATMSGSNSVNPPGDSFDVHTYWRYGNLRPGGHMFSKLLRNKRGPGVAPDDFTQYEGDVATGLPEQPDDSTYIYTLRDNMLFHDKPPVNGRALTPQDVLYSVQRWREVSNLASSWRNEVAKEEIGADGTFVVTTDGPFAPFLNLTASPDGIYILAAENIEDGSIDTNPSGTGPWIFEKYVPDSGIDFNRNPNWYEEGFPLMDRQERALIVDEPTIIARMVTGDVDFSVFGPTRVDALLADKPDLETIYTAQTSVGGWIINYSVEPFNDPRMRLALSVAMDRDGEQAITDPGGPGIWNTHYVPHPPWYTNPKNEEEFGPGAKFFQHDPALSRQLQSAAGYPDGFDINVASLNAPSFFQQIEAIQSLIQESGFRSEFDYKDIMAYVTQVFRGGLTGDEHIGFGPWKSVQADPDGTIDSIYHPDAGNHAWGPGPGSPAEDLPFIKLMENSRKELDLDARVAMFHQMWNHMAENMYNIPYAGASSVMVHQPNLRDLNLRNGYDEGTTWIPYMWRATTA